MININFGSNFILGCFVSIVGIALYSVRFLNPKVAEEKDIFLSTLFLIYSGIIIVHGWRLDPILFFSQLLIVFLSINFFMENLTLRLQVLKQKKKVAIKKQINSQENEDTFYEKSQETLDIFDIFS
jgi:hypothetical protein